MLDSSLVDSPQFEKTWRQRFTSFGQSHHDDAGIAGWSATSLAARLRCFARVWRPRKAGDLWLDAGCGAGSYSRYLVQKGIRVLGVDYSIPTLQKARERCPAVIRWAAADANALPVRSGICDGAMCFGVTQALSNPGRLAAEMSRVVRPGGEVWIDALNSRCLMTVFAESWRKLRGRPPRLRYTSARELRSMMQTSGIGRIRIYWIPILPGRLAFLERLIESRVGLWLIQNVPLVGSLISHSFIATGETGRGE